MVVRGVVWSRCRCMKGECESEYSEEGSEWWEGGGFV